MSGAPPLRSVESLDVAGKRVFLRADLNVPLRDRRIADDTRVRASLETLAGCASRAPAWCSPRTSAGPRASAVEELSLRPVAERLGIALAPDCIGEDEVEQVGRPRRDGDAILLENLRYHAGEEAERPGVHPPARRSV